MRSIKKLHLNHPPKSTNLAQAKFAIGASKKATVIDSWFFNFLKASNSLVC